VDNSHVGERGKEGFPYCILARMKQRGEEGEPTTPILHSKEDRRREKPQRRKKEEESIYLQPK